MKPIISQLNQHDGFCTLTHPTGAEMIYFVDIFMVVSSVYGIVFGLVGLSKLAKGRLAMCLGGIFYLVTLFFADYFRGYVDKIDMFLCAILSAGLYVATLYVIRNLILASRF